MKKILLASACILALSSASAIAQQGQPAPGPSSQGNVGPDTPKGEKKGMTTGEAKAMRDKRVDSKGSMPSGAGPKTNNMGRVIPPPQ
jgi:hypothetical protein